MKNQVQLQRRIGFEDTFLFPVTDNVGTNGFRNFEMETQNGSGKRFLQEKLSSFSQARSLSEHLQFYGKSLGPHPNRVEEAGSREKALGSSVSEKKRFRKENSSSQTLSEFLE